MTSGNVTKAEAEALEPSEVASKSVVYGEDGLLEQLTKRLLESALGGEITEPLG